MATILEFDELPEGSQVTFATQSGGPIIAKAVEAPVIPPPPDPPTPSEVGGVVSFLTVARVSAKRLLDAPFAMVATWTDGQPIYTRSFGGAEWHWQADYPASSPTDNETTCRPSSWAGIDGAAVRSLAGNRLASAQTEWQINSTAADNEGAGTVADPLKTDVEIQRRLGPGSADILNPTRIVYAQSPAGLTNLSVNIRPNASLTFQGTRTAIVSGVAITAVTTQNRATPVRWAITAAGLVAAHVGKLVFITAGTAANVGAYARILKDQGGGSVVVSPFGKFDIVGEFTQVIPAVGDVVEVVDLTTLKPGIIEINNLTGGAARGASPTRNVVLLDSILLDGGAGLVGAIIANNIPTLYARSIITQTILGGRGQAVFSHTLCGGGSSFFFPGPGTSIRLRQTGCLANTPTGAAFSASGHIVLQLEADCYLHDCGMIVSAGGPTVNPRGIALFDGTAGQSKSLGVFQGGSIRNTSGTVADWGTNNATFAIRCSSGGCYEYTLKPTINAGLGVGRETIIGGVDKLYAAVPFTDPSSLARINVQVV